MTRALIAVLVACAPLAACLYLLPVSERGLIGPDEPRYASIGRQMAESGDWVTPNLWGEPWFEKPAMLFWLGAAGHLVGLEAYSRVPVALLCLGFLVLLFHLVRQEFGADVAACAVCILATAAGWVAYADAGVFDAPVTVFTAAALLCLLPWLSDPASEVAQRRLPWFGALLGLAVLSKGLVGPIVATLSVLPAVVTQPRRVLDLFSLRAVGPFAAVCLPWYAACYWRHGDAFLGEFFVRHHWERFFSPGLQHVQPAWFFVPVVLGFLLPWTPLVLGLRRATLWSEPRLRFLTAWTMLPLAFFSISVNKLPGYILPILPPLAVLLAVQWTRRPSTRLLVVAACTLALLPLAGALLPKALADGITRAWADMASADLATGAVLGLTVAGGAAACALSLRSELAVPGVAALAAVALTLLKMQAYPDVSHAAGTRELLTSNQRILAESCIGQVRRHTTYGIQHYSRNAVPPCENGPEEWRIEGDPPRFTRAVVEPRSDE